MEENFFSSEPNHHFQVQAVNLWGVYVVCRSWEKAGQDLSSQLNPLILRFQVLTAGINLGDLMIRPTCSILKLPLTSPMDWTSGLSCCQFGAAAQGVEEDPKSRCSRDETSVSNIFSCSPRTLGKCSNLTVAYFSNGLVQPPTTVARWSMGMKFGYFDWRHAMADEIDSKKRSQVQTGRRRRRWKKTILGACLCVCVFLDIIMHFVWLCHCDDGSDHSENPQPAICYLETTLPNPQVVILDVFSNKQLFFEGHTNDVLCLVTVLSGENSSHLL